MSEEPVSSADLVKACKVRLEAVLAFHNLIYTTPIPFSTCHSEEDFEQARNAAKYLPIIKRELELVLGLYERVFKILAKG